MRYAVVFYVVEDPPQRCVGLFDNEEQARVYAQNELAAIDREIMRYKILPFENPN